MPVRTRRQNKAQPPSDGGRATEGGGGEGGGSGVTCKPTPGKIYAVAKDKFQAARMKEVHKEKFKDDAERRSVAIGYVIIMVCNGLSVWSLAQYMFNGMPPAVELDYELAFLVIKTIIEMMTNKFSWPLLLHHTATFIGIAFFSKHEDLQCVTWVVVHQQLVHFPFMVRAAWRLTLPALGYNKKLLSYRRRFLSNFFWMSWMFIIGYRTPILWLYASYSAFKLGLVWQGLLTWVFAAILSNLDRVWTKAMWPKTPKPTMLHEAYFHTGTRLMFVTGLCTAILIFLNDIDEPGLYFDSDETSRVVPAALQFRLVGHTNRTYLQCLDGQELTRLPMGTGVWR
jgi:hypothetical protein